MTDQMTFPLWAIVLIGIGGAIIVWPALYMIGELLAEIRHRIRDGERKLR